MNSRVYVLVSGKVQGVFFRSSAKKRADELNLTGWVKNLDDGRVEAVFEVDIYSYTLNFEIWKILKHNLLRLTGKCQRG